MRELYCVDASRRGLVRRGAESFALSALFLLSRVDWSCGAALPKRLRFCRRRSRSLRWRSVLFFEGDFRRLPRAFVGLEVRVVPGKSAHSRDYVVREERKIRVVVLQSVVVAAPFH